MLAGVLIIFAAITLAAVSEVLPMTPTAVMVIAPSVWVAESTGTGAAMCGVTGVPTTGPWSTQFEPGQPRKDEISHFAEAGIRALAMTSFINSTLSPPMALL
jgi:hypothetical protein